MFIPDTHPSLLVRICDPSDREAWDDFSEMYRDVVYRLGLMYGLQPCDAEDLTQKVLLRVSRAIESFEWQPGRAKFRTWLKTIARNEIINTLSRDPRRRGQEVLCESAVWRGIPQPEADTGLIESAYRREVFLVAAAKIRDEFEEHTWQAFWWTLVDGLPVENVAERLGIRRGSVYTARFRILKRLKAVVERLEAGDNDA